MREKLLEAERHVDRLASQPKSLAALHEAIETAARAKGVPVSMTAHPSSLHVTRGGGRTWSENNIEIKDGSFHLNYMDLGDTGSVVFDTLPKVTWYIVAHIAAPPSVFMGMRLRFEPKKKPTGPDGPQ
jgi:hypothetical protein